MNRLNAVALCTMSGLSFNAYAQPYYRLTDLGALTTPGGSWATAVNASGQVAGFSFYDNNRRLSEATRITNGATTRLGRFPNGNWSWAWGINDSGRVVGISHDPVCCGDFKAFRSDGGAMTLLAQLVPGGTISAFGINAAGTIVGSADPGSGAHPELLGTRKAVRWTGNQITDLGTLGGFNSYAFAINTAGDIVGASDLLNGPFHACLWRGGTKTDLGTLGGQASEAFDINDSAQIVGWANLPEGTRRAFLWQGGTMSDLGTLGTSSEARAINRDGWIVGTSWVTGEGQRAFVRSPGGSPRNLNARVLTLGDWVIQHATDINNSGVIVGYGRVNGATRAFLLRPGLCAADIDADGFLTGADFDAFVQTFESGQAIADFDGDGFVTGLDFDRYTQAFEAGC